MGDVWRGLDKQGQQIEITHAKLMDWAYENEEQFSIGWGNTFTMPSGGRLVRFRAGNVSDAIAAAESQGWNDIAELIRATVPAAPAEADAKPSLSGIPANAVCIFQDDEKWCAVYGEFFEAINALEATKAAV